MVGIHPLNNILPRLWCASFWLERKTNHSLRVIWISKLSNARVKVKLIRNRGDHVGDAPIRYEKNSEGQELSNV